MKNPGYLMLNGKPITRRVVRKFCKHSMFYGTGIVQWVRMPDHWAINVINPFDFWIDEPGEVSQEAWDQLKPKEKRS